MVDSVKQYNLAGVAANVELGKQGPVIDSSNASVIAFKNKNGNASVIAIAEGTDLTHGVTLNQLDGISLNALSYITTTVNYNSGNVVVGNVSANTFIHSVNVDSSIAWTDTDANTEITVGDTGSATILFSDFDISSQSTFDTKYKYTSGSTISIFVTQGNASAGAAKVTIWYSGTISDADLPGGGGTAGVDNVTGYDEMPPPVTAGGDLEDTTATINSPTGFTINDNTKTGVAINALSDSNKAFFTTYGTGTKTVTWGAGSTVASSTITVVTNNPTGFPQLVFRIEGQTGAATYNYPFTFS